MLKASSLSSLSACIGAVHLTLTGPLSLLEKWLGSSRWKEEGILVYLWASRGEALRKVGYYSQLARKDSLGEPTTHRSDPTARTQSAS